MTRFTLLSGVCLLGPTGCFGLAVDGDGIEDDAELGTSWEALMADGDVGAITPGSPSAPVPTPPPAGCDGCTAGPLALWNFDDCNAQSTQLADSAYTSPSSHPAFRAVSVACVEGASGQGVRLSRPEDVVYAPDQPDFVFDQGVSIAAFVNPDRVRGTQSIVRKRFDDSSSFVLALDNRQLSFVVRLQNGRLASASAPLEAGHFTHVAATYDNKQLRLYLDGKLAARTRAAGKIARGAGPLFVGNDADGRQFKGVIDELWLDTRAASDEAVLALTCIRRPPTVSLAPPASSAQIAGVSVSYELSITNRNSESCAEGEFDYFPSLPYGLLSDSYGRVSLAPGATAHATLDVRSSKAAAAGFYPFQVYAYDASTYLTFGVADATYVVGTGPISCDGSPPYTSQITGSADSPVGGIALYAAPGLNEPNVTPLMSPDGVLQALQISANPGVPTAPGNDWFGADLFLNNPSCVDASAYAGVQFTVTGDLGTCKLALEVVTAQDNQVAFGGSCTESICFGPLSQPVGTGTSFIRFEDMTGGVPMPSVDPTAIQGIQWAMNAPSDGISEPCVADFTISDVSFVAAP